MAQPLRSIRDSLVFELGHPSVLTLRFFCVGLTNRLPLLFLEYFLSVKFDLPLLFLLGFSFACRFSIGVTHPDVDNELYISNGSDYRFLDSVGLCT